MIATTQPRPITMFRDLQVHVHRISVIDEEFISIDKRKSFILVQMIDPNGFVVVDQNLADWCRKHWKFVFPTFPRDCNLVATQHTNHIQERFNCRVSLMATCPIVSSREKTQSTFVRRVGTKFQNHEPLSKCCTSEHFALFLESSKDFRKECSLKAS